MADSHSTVISRSQTESQRNIGYLLHPCITDKLSSSPTIADIGTGTGLFLTRLAKQYPKAILRGFDISSKLFPAPETLPANFELRVMDVKCPPPETEHNRYDVVHVRLLTVAMNSEDWEVAVRNIARLLKPGGALQWEEGNLADGRHLRGGPESSVSAARFVGSLFREGLKEKFAYGWNTLPQIMRTTGFVDVVEDIVSSDRVAETRQALTANGMRAMCAWAKYRMDRDAPGSPSLNELQEIEAQAWKDIQSGCYVRFDIHIVVGLLSA
ncbi:MAG: hypothetical protein Q9181_007048 [Wetmoreana brouardii]